MHKGKHECGPAHQNSFERGTFLFLLGIGVSILSTVILGLTSSALLVLSPSVIIVILVAGAAIGIISRFLIYFGIVHFVHELVPPGKQDLLWWAALLAVFIGASSQVIGIFGLGWIEGGITALGFIPTFMFYLVFSDSIVQVRKGAVGEKSAYLEHRAILGKPAHLGQEPTGPFDPSTWAVEEEEPPPPPPPQEPIAVREEMPSRTSEETDARAEPVVPTALDLFECPLCNTKVGENVASCPGCGAKFEPEPDSLSPPA